MTLRRQRANNNTAFFCRGLVPERCTAVASPSMRSEFTISSTWDGIDLSGDEWIRLTLEQGPADTLQLTVDAPFHGDPPPTDAPGSTWELWEYEVVELFLVRDDGSYLEIEIGPHGHHLVLELSAPRQIQARHLPATLVVERRGARWSAKAHIQVQCPLASVVQANAFAIHGAGDARRFLAAFPLPGPRPDFHQPGRFPAFVYRS